jgi:hypothetical protein
MFWAMFFAHHQEHLTIFTASGNIPPMSLPAATLVNITRCCKYYKVLLMMGENFARNM